jgi:saccharopine dehydrogenase-like NADP-dependent oxidoreductase
MKVLVIGGAGAMGIVTVRDLTESPEVSEAVKCMYSLVFHHHKKYGVSALAYLAGMPLSIVSQMLCRSLIKQMGVLPPDAAKPERFFAEIAKRGVKIPEEPSKQPVLFKLAKGD